MPALPDNLSSATQYRQPDSRIEIPNLFPKNRHWLVKSTKLLQGDSAIQVACCQRTHESREPNAPYSYSHPIYVPPLNVTLHAHRSFRPAEVSTRLRPLCYSPPDSDLRQGTIHASEPHCQPHGAYAPTRMSMTLPAACAIFSRHCRAMTAASVAGADAIAPCRQVS